MMEPGTRGDRPRLSWLLRATPLPHGVASTSHQFSIASIMRTLILGSLLVLTSLAPRAQQTLGSAPVPAPSESEPRAPGYFDVMEAFGQWNEARGGLWRLEYEKRTQAARFLYGGSAAGSFVPGSDDDYFVLARELLSETFGMHRVNAATLVERRVVFLPLGMAGGSDKMTVRFTQEVRGVPVIGGSVNVLFDTKGRLLSIDVSALPDLAGFATTPALGEAVARAAAAQLFRQDAGVDPTLLERGELKIVRHRESKHFQPRLVWEVNAQWERPGFTGEGWRYRIDAVDGGLLGREPSIHSDVSGKVQSFSSPAHDPDDGANAVTADMPYITVTSSQGNATADVDGNFTIPGASPPLQVTAQYSGTFAITNDQSSSNYSLTTLLNSTSGNNILMNPGAPEDDTAEANAFKWIGLMRNWTRTVNPADATSDFLATANVNQSSTCNATWTGNAVNFRLQGGGCVNSAYASVVLHEMGHWMNALYNSGNGSDGFGEGNSDVFSIYVLDDPLIGKDFFGPGQHIRDANNANLYCGSGCYGQVHADGEVLMGALWNVRQNLKSTYGAGAGSAVANTLFNGWMNAYDDGTITPLIEIHWLTLDDNNGNISDGTPNYLDIDGGFVQQAFPGYQLTYVAFTNVVEPPDTQNEVGPYTVTADLTAQITPPVSGALLYYSVDGAPYTPVAMSPVSGSTYTADIPGHISPAVVRWYLEASDGGAQSNTYPATGAAVPKKFEIGEKKIFFFEDFESGIAGWTHGLNAQQDDWQRTADVGATNGSFGKAGDALTAFSGTQIWGNDLGPSGWNGFYQDNVDNWLRSPSIDLSSSSGAKLRFQRWLTVEDGASDQARVLIDGSEVWVNVTGSNTIDTFWNEVEVDISAWDGDPDVTIEFKMESDGSVNFGGWNIDDVTIMTLNASGSSTVSYCTAGTSASGCQATLSSTGSPSATAPSGFTLIASNVEGLKDGLFFFGTNGRQAVPWGNGTSFQCVVPPVVRTPLLSGTGANGGCNGVLSRDLNALWCPSCSNPAKNPGAGAVVQSELWYRDPSNTSNSTTSLSDAREFLVGP